MSHLHHVVSSPIARLLPPPSPFEPNRSPHIPTMSFRARPLVSHPHRVNSSATARVSPSIRTLRARLLVSDPTVSIRARPLVSRLHQALSSPAASLPPNRVNSSATARVPPSTRSLRARLLVSDSTVSIRAQPLVSRLHQAFSSPATCLPSNRVNSSATAHLSPSLLTPAISTPVPALAHWSRHNRSPDARHSLAPCMRACMLTRNHCCPGIGLTSLR